MFSTSVPVQGVFLVSEPNPPVIYEGTGFNLSCQARKGTHLVYFWYHNEQEVTSLSPLHHFAGNILTVERAAERHAGSYSCVAKNMLGNEIRVSSSRLVTIIVKSNHYLHVDVKIKIISSICLIIYSRFILFPKSESLKSVNW